LRSRPHAQEQELTKFQKLDPYSRTILVLGCIACAIIFPFLVFDYPETDRLANEYLNAPECGNEAITTPFPRNTAVCTSEEKKILKLSRTGGRSRSYYVVLQDVSGVDSKVLLESLSSKGDVSRFWDAASRGDVVQIQRFHGKVISLSGHSIYVATSDHPQWQISNLKTGMELTGGGAVFLFLFITYLRRAPSP
jgi:hypothetical protein